MAMPRWLDDTTGPYMNTPLGPVPHIAAYSIQFEDLFIYLYAPAPPGLDEEKYLKTVAKTVRKEDGKHQYEPHTHSRIYYVFKGPHGFDPQWLSFTMLGPVVPNQPTPAPVNPTEAAVMLT